MKKIIAFFFSILFVFTIAFCQETTKNEPTKEQVLQVLNKKLATTVGENATHYFLSNITGINRDKLYNDFTKYNPKIELQITSFKKEKINEFNYKTTVYLTIKITGQKSTQFHSKLFFYFVRDEKNQNDKTWYIDHFELVPTK